MSCNHLAITKMADQNNSAFAANLNSPTEREEKPVVSLQSIFETIVFSLFDSPVILIIPVLLFSFQKTLRKRVHPMSGKRKDDIRITEILNKICFSFSY